MTRARMLAGALVATVLVGCDGALPAAEDAGGDTDAVIACARDADCDDALFCTGQERCAPGAMLADGRGCVTAPACSALQSCDEASDSCATDCGATRDADGDGARARECGGDDCDDANPEAHPDALEVCDADDTDEDCDPSTFGARDADDDGFVDAACCNAQPSGPALCGDDCDDTRAGTHVGEAEECNGLDDDCDAAIDEALLVRFVRDADLDGHGSSEAGAESRDACVAPDGFSASSDDCDDARGSVHPGSYDACDAAGVDDDCSGTPNDPPGGCTCDTGRSRTCPLPGVCAASTQTCIDGLWGGCGLAVLDEICANGVDDDCDGAIDDGCACVEAFRVCGIDEGACARGVQSCTGAGAWGPCVGSRDPSPDVCNDVDDDCDGAVDEDLLVLCYLDGDGDGFAYASATATTECGACPAGMTARAPTLAADRDCDDGDARAFPGQTMYFGGPRSTVGGFDFDCDGALAHDAPNMGCTTAPGGGCVAGTVWSGSTSLCGMNVGETYCYAEDGGACGEVAACSPSPGFSCGRRINCR